MVLRIARERHRAPRRAQRGALRRGPPIGAETLAPHDTDARAEWRSGSRHRAGGVDPTTVTLRAPTSPRSADGRDGHNCIGCIGTPGAPADLSAVRGDVRPRDPRATTSRSSCIRARPRRRVERRATSARRARRSATCTTIPTACARRWCASRRARGARSSWDEAFARCERAAAAGDRGARHRGGHRVRRQPARAQASASSRYIGVLIGMSGIPMIYSPGTVDQWPKNVSSHLMYGGMWTIPVPDVQPHRPPRRHGRQPARVAGLAARVPRPDGRDRRDPRARRRGDRRSTPAAPAPPTGPTSGSRSRPAPTPRCCSRSCTCSSPRGSSTSARSPSWSTASTSLRALVADWTPERVAPRTGIAADRIRRLAHELADDRARRCSTAASGCATRSSARSPSWLVDVVNILTGHFDVAGGLMFPRPAAWPVTDPADARPRGRRRPTSAAGRSRVRGAPEVLGQVPVSCLAEEIATPGDGQIRALFTVAGNPVLSTPGRRPARRGAGRARLHDQRRQLDQRDHPPRRRHPARAVARSSSRTTTT